jgi:hypothetical protein
VWRRSFGVYTLTVDRVEPWGEVLPLTGGAYELLIPTQFGIRILHFSWAGEENLFWTEPSQHLYTILLNLDALRIDRAQFIEELKAHNIGTSVHFIPIHYHPHYARYGWQRGQFPNAEQYYERTLSSPLYPAMSDQDVADVIEAVYDVGKRWRR